MIGAAEEEACHADIGERALLPHQWSNAMPILEGCAIGINNNSHFRHRPSEGCVEYAYDACSQVR